MGRLAAGLVCSNAAGMAAGPLMSIPLQKLPDVLWHGLRVNRITAPALVTAFSWLSFLATFSFTFEDPLKVIR